MKYSGESSLGGGRTNEMNRRPESKTDGGTQSTVATSSSIPSSMISNLPHPNAQFLLANPWLHTSLLYSQLYNNSQRVHPPPLLPSSSSSVLLGGDDAGESTDQVIPTPCKFNTHRRSPTPTTTPKSSSPASSTTTKDSSTAVREVDNNKRSEVWRPY